MPKNENSTQIRIIKTTGLQETARETEPIREDMSVSPTMITVSCISPSVLVALLNKILTAVTRALSRGH